MACYQAEHLDENQEVRLEFADLALDHEIMYNSTDTTIEDVAKYTGAELTDFLADHGIVQVASEQAPAHDELWSHHKTLDLVDHLKA